MKYSKLTEYTPHIEQLLDGWSYPKMSPERTRKLADIQAWLGNFDDCEFELAFKILQNIQYFNDHEIRTIVCKLSSKIKNILEKRLHNSLFFPLGTSSSSSGSMFLYQYRKELNLSAECFRQENFKNFLNTQVNMFFFDDIIGSGNQAIDFFTEHLTDCVATCYYLSIFGMDNGVKNIQQNANFKNVYVGKRLRNGINVFEDSSNIFTVDEKKMLKPFCEKYGEKLFKKHPLGYNNAQALIALPHSTPNNSLPIIWANDQNEAMYSDMVWHPLFERIQISPHSLITTSFAPIKKIKGSFYFDREDILKYALRFVKDDFINDKSTRRFDIIGHSGTGKTYFTKNMIINLNPDDNVLYIDLNSDDFFINLFFELLIYSSLTIKHDGLRTNIPQGTSFNDFLNIYYQDNKSRLIEAFYAVICQLPGMESLTPIDDLGKPNTPIQDVSSYFFEYLRWITKKKRQYIIIDNYQFLTERHKMLFETNLSSIQNNLCFIPILRILDSEVGEQIEVQQFKYSSSVFLSELTISEITTILEAENPCYKDIAPDCLLKTQGNLKEIEYYLTQLRQNKFNNRQKDNIKSLVDNISNLAELEQYLMTISSLFPTGMDKSLVAQLIHIIIQIDDNTFNEAVNHLIKIGYLVLNGDSGTVLKPAHEKIINSIAKSLGENSFREIYSVLIDSFEQLLSTMNPTKEYNYLLHCFVGIFTAEHLKSKLNHVIKLLDVQYKANRYDYLITFYNHACKESCWQEVVELLPQSSLEQLLDSMQKTSEFYSALALLNQIKLSSYSSAETLTIYEVKNLTQTYRFEEALKLINTFEESEQTKLYKLNILQHLGLDAEAKKIANEALCNNDQALVHSEYYYVILRNTAQYFPFDTAISNLLRALRYFANKGLRFGEATVRNNLGVTYLWANELKTAEEYLISAEKTLTDLNSNEIFEPQCNLSVLYSLRKSHELSLEYSCKALKYFPKNLSYDYIMLQNNDHIIRLEQDIIQAEEALCFFKEQIVDVQSFSDPWLTFVITYNLNSLEKILYGKSDIISDQKYCQTPKDETGSIVFKEIEVCNIKADFAFTLSPNWRY